MARAGMPEARAKIEWMRAPPTSSFVAPVRFKGDNSWPNEAWSLVVEWPPLGNSDTYAVRFLVPDAPRQFLKEGARFELCDGTKPIATGTII